MNPIVSIISKHLPYVKDKREKIAEEIHAAILEAGYLFVSTEPLAPKELTARQKREAHYQRQMNGLHQNGVRVAKYRRKKIGA